VTKFTPANIQKIKNAVAQGLSREQIAQLLGVPLGSLQVTCSRLGISLRKENAAPKQWPRWTSAASGVPAPQQRDVAHMRNEEAKFQLIVKTRGKELATDIPMTPHAVERLVLEAWAQDLSMIELMGRLLMTAIKTDMIQEILREDLSSGNTGRSITESDPGIVDP
jgi:hypothetical protein